MKPTIEELLATAEASVVAVTTERDEIRTSFEKLASEQVASIEAANSEVAAKDVKLNELTVAIDGLTAEKAELIARIAALEGNAITASVEAAKVCASVGVTPVESAPAPTAAETDNDIREQFLAMPFGVKRTAFFNAHKKVILGLR